MEQVLWNIISQTVDIKTFLILAGLYIIYRKIGVVECGVRSGLLAHITRIHAGAVRNGTISKDALQIVSECYTQYKRLGGDGYADQLMKEIDDLKTK